MSEAESPRSAADVPDVRWHRGLISRDERWMMTGGPGLTVWLTGLSGSGKSTVAMELERLLVRRGRAAYVLDGDNLRHGLNSDLGFSPDERSENVRRVGEVARLLADAGIVAIVPLISPFADDRRRVAAAHAAAHLRFLEVFVDTPLETCEQRDPKGLYARARRGELADFTGVDSPYEAPVAPDVVIRHDEATALDWARRLADIIG